MKALTSLTIGLCVALALISGSFGSDANALSAPVVFMVAVVWAFVSVLCYFAIEGKVK